MVNPHLREAITDALSSHSLVLLDKNVTCLTGSSLDALVDAQLPAEVPASSLEAVRKRFRQWITSFRPSVQTVSGVAEEVYREHDLLRYRGSELAGLLEESYARGSVSASECSEHLQRLEELADLQEEFSNRVEVTRANVYTPRDYGSYTRLFQDVLGVSRAYNSKASCFKEHDVSNTADEQLVAAAVHHSNLRGSAAILSSDNDINYILGDYQQSRALAGVVSVYTFQPHDTSTLVLNSYTAQSRSSRLQSAEELSVDLLAS